jgi:hypothetical protein
MRTSTRIVTVALASLALATAGCSSSNPSSGGSDTSPVTNAAVDPGTGETTVPAPAGNTGDWPPADMCTVLSTEALQALTGETISAATPNDGANVYGPYCDYLSDKSGLFMSISSFTPEDWASYTESQVAQGGTTELSGIGDSAILKADPTFNDSTVYVLSGNTAFSVHVTSQTDNGWTPEITTQIATAVASAMLGG